ncbi:myeloid-derived growth factor homolog [Rhopilema esculentum]|uniref:myeloid-derived growth factor homolog n=1 Tax=Rhopilema esculentum TaxID=499914 RepID=UPI0031DF822E
MLITVCCEGKMASSKVRTSLGLSCSIIASFCLISLTILPTQTLAENSASHNFMAQPFGQEISEEVALGNVKCQFKYKCVGGTGEGWEMRLEKKGSEYHCVIDRPEQSSYLFFMMFEASVEGVKLQRAEPYDNSKRMLHDDEFKVKGNTVKSGSAFKSNLATLALIAKQK